MNVTQSRVEAPTPAIAVYQLEAKEGEVVLLRERFTVDLTTADPLASLAHTVERFTARAEQIAANMAIMP